MGREIKRVPLDFAWPEGEVWKGYYPDCAGCEFDDDDDCTSDEDCPRRFDPPAGDGWQIWETVSEGSPNSPVFATKEELIEYVHYKGAGGVFKPASRAAARKFVEAGWAPSMAIMNGYIADGVNSFSAAQPPFLSGFDALSDDVLDLLKEAEGLDEVEGLVNICKIDQILLTFRERVDNFAQLHQVLSGVFWTVRGVEKLPEEVDDALKACEELMWKLYPQVMEEQKEKAADAAAGGPPPLSELLR
jgi:hypothetical protein